MASVVQICNMALSHIGSHATISSISPPDGSVEAGHCATFYDQARTELIDTGNWRFALSRSTLAPLATNLSDTWLYSYSLPSDCMSPKRILRKGAGLTVFNQDTTVYFHEANDDDGADFLVEGDVLYTNEPEATLVYARDVTDTTKFNPSFTTVLSFMLASYLAGPIVKGNEGLRLGDAMRERAMALADIAATSSAGASSTTAYRTPTIVGVRS